MALVASEESGLRGGSSSTVVMVDMAAEAEGEGERVGSCCFKLLARRGRRRRVEEEGVWGGGGEGEGEGRKSRASKKMSSEVGEEEEAPAEGSSASMGGR